MNLVKEVYDYMGMTLWRKTSNALQVAATILCFAKVYMRTATVFSIVSLGGATLYYVSKRRIKLKPSDLVVITGCNSGLGYSLALHCRAQGATVLAGVRDTVVEKICPGIESLKAKGIITHDVDITNEESVQEFVNKVKELLEERQLVLRALVNNAGVMIFGEFEWQMQSLAEYQVNINVLGTLRMTRQLMPMIRRDSSRIIVVSSHCSAEPLPGISIYAATKAALDAWATALRTEVGKYGVSVVSFIPGGFVSQSNIMKRQRRHFEEMAVYISYEAKQFYGDYFTRYCKYFSDLQSDKDEVTVLSNVKIYETFDSALLEVYPSPIYRCETWKYFFYRILFKTTPTCIRDRLTQRFVNPPSWHVTYNNNI
ncbi:D-beta-hydroxybutyrate dehydrogenase, mitochondrial [Anoplolepis gracilipes]|uniref:D-beta-hydroxybutyrate dehydrogenase, mitochondrial n=1 Tax=Anoplolepis gracilipes TaxID=354296 RepID=UPI003B9F7228